MADLQDPIDVLLLSPGEENHDDKNVAIKSIVNNESNEDDKLYSKEMINLNMGNVDNSITTYEDETQNEITQELDKEFNELEKEKQIEIIVKNDDEINLTKSNDLDVKSNDIKLLFKNSRYFLIKSNNHENVNISKLKGVWQTTKINESKINQAFKECANVLLIFSVSESGHFQGYARLASESKDAKDGHQINWILPPNLNNKSLSGIFFVDWITRKELQFNKTQHLLNAWNENKPVKIGRDGQEIEGRCGELLCNLFTIDPDINIETILSKVKKQNEQLNQRSINLSMPIITTNYHQSVFDKSKPFRHRNFMKNNANQHQLLSYENERLVNYKSNCSSPSSSSASSRTKKRTINDVSKSNKTTTILEYPKRQKHRSKSPKSSKHLNPTIMNIPKDVLLNGTYQDYQSYIAASGNTYSNFQQQQQQHGYYAQTQNHQHSLNQLETPYLAPYHYNHVYDCVGSSYGLNFSTSNDSIHNPTNLPNLYDQLHSNDLGKSQSTYEQDVEEFLRRTSNNSSRNYQHSNDHQKNNSGKSFYYNQNESKEIKNKDISKKHRSKK